jgi:hypothetical protein
MPTIQVEVVQLCEPQVWQTPGGAGRNDREASASIQEKNQQKNQDCLQDCMATVHMSHKLAT